MSIELKNVSYQYDNPGEAHSGRTVLKDINLKLNRDEFTAIIGATGSGKSTLIQHLNGLLKPTEGEVLYEGRNIHDKDFDRKQLRADCGMVFQYPEYQLFETSVLKDVSFGPKNVGMSDEEAESNARESLKLVGIDEEDFDKSPFELSGGQKRRCAIAGVLAMAPKYLILDEPAAGLDPRGKHELLSLLSMLHSSAGMGIIIVSHDMDDVAEYADRVIALDHGRIKFDDSPKNVFANYDVLKAMGLAIPNAALIADRLRKLGWNLPLGITTIEETKKAILECLEK